MPTSSFNLSDLDGSNGFVINGLNPRDWLGRAVSNAGDINGDGIDDLIIGAPFADSNGSNSGSTYIVFGGTTLGLDGSFDLSTLDGSNGFVLNGIETSSQFYSQLGSSVSGAGDINADGIADLIISAPGEPIIGQPDATYVLFGGSNIGAGGSIERSSLDGSNGFLIGFRSSIGFLYGDGYYVSDAGDINGDGIDDLIIGMPTDGYSSGGTSYVVFGSSDLGVDGSFDLLSLDGSNGFSINYDDLYDDFRVSGNGVTSSVSGAGDINNDGFADLIIGVAGSLGYVSPGPNIQSYVIFGGPNVTDNGRFEISDLDGSNGFVINSVERFDNLGWSVSSAGDFNGDGIDDLIIGAPGQQIFNDNYGNASSKSYVVFGAADVAVTGSNLSTLNGTNGFVINGINPDDRLGRSVSNAGDINGDGITDLIIGAPFADPNDASSGSTYIIFGGAGGGAGGSFDLLSLDGSNGFVIDGIAAGDVSGYSVSGAGDVNADGIDDVIIGAPGADINGNISGSSYIVFGSPVSVAEATAGDDTLLGTNAGDIIRGEAGNDLINGRNGNDTLLGNRGNDTLIGGNGDDLLFGGWGRDLLIGGVGADSFLLAANTGTDTIDDFESGIDSLVLFNGLSFEQLAITQSDNDTLLSLASNNRVIATLTGIAANSISSVDFISI